MKCPVDNIDLVMSDRQGIEIDYCPQCRGVWLDRGEIDKIVERSTSAGFGPAPQAQAQPQPQHYSQPPQQAGYQQQRRDYDDDDDHHYNQGHNQHHKRKESWFGELFD